MALRKDIIDDDSFSKGEDFQITVNAVNRDGSALDDAATQTFDFIISTAAGAAALLTFSGSPQIVLDDAPAARWLVSLSPVDLTTLTAGVEYWYEVWTTSAGGIELHQIKGKMTLATATGN